MGACGMGAQYMIWPCGMAVAISSVCWPMQANLPKRNITE